MFENDEIRKSHSTFKTLFLKKISLVAPNADKETNGDEDN